MPWIVPVAAIAANLFGKRDAERKAARANLNDTLLNIANTRAHQLGAQPYSGMVDSMMLHGQQQLLDSKNAGSNLGSVLQAYSAISGAYGSGDSPKTGGDDLASAEFMKHAGDYAAADDPTQSDFFKHAGTLASGGDLSSDYDRLDPWKRR